MSLLPLFNQQSFALETPGARLNYGLNKVRFPQPGPGGVTAALPRVLRRRHRPAAGKQLIIKHTLEIEGVEKPACVAELVVLLLA